MGGWGPSSQICDEWERMSQGNLRWNDIEVCSDDDVDFWVLVNHPFGEEHFVPERTIVLQMEPWCAGEDQTWGVKTWGEWSRPDPFRFLQVRSHDRYLNNVFWRMKSTYAELSERPIEKTGVLATMCSPKYFDPGHVKRVDFLKYLDERNDDVVTVDLYAYDNPLGFASWVGPHPVGENDAALLPYRYFLGVENNAEHNFVTEKLWEPLLAESLCFYWGAPNAAEHVDPRAFIPIDLDDFDAAFETIRAAILTDQWSKRIDVIRSEKRRILDRLQFFPMLETILRDDFRFDRRPTDEEVFHHKYFAADLEQRFERVAFIHVLVRDDDTRILGELLDAIESAKLLERLDRVVLVTVGGELSLEHLGRATEDGYRVIHLADDPTIGESGTLELVRSFCQVHRESNVLYLHTKGASYDETFEVIEDWRRMMVHFVVEQADEALSRLDEDDVVGCNLLASPRPHFSGNFWWARGSYLRTLPSPAAESRHAAEWWVCSGSTVRASSLHDSGLDHYRNTYPRESYARN